MPARRAPARRSAVAAGLALLAAACASSRAAAPPRPQQDELAPGWTRRAFAVRDEGRVVLSLPPGWTATEGEEGEAAVPAIRLERSDDRFRVLLTPLWNPGEPEEPQARTDTAQLFAEIARRKGATVIVITASGSPLALEALTAPHHILLAADHPEDADRYSPMVSRLLHLLIIDILTTGVALRLGSAELRPMLQEIKKNLRAKRYVGSSESSSSTP